MEKEWFLQAELMSGAVQQVLTKVCVLKMSDGPLVQTLSPSRPITRLQMFIFGSKGLLAITISPLEEWNMWGQNKADSAWQYYQ